MLICLSLNYARKAIDVVPTARRVDQWQAPGFKGALDLGIPALARELLLRVLKAACGPLIRLRGRAGGVESLQVALLIGGTLLAEASGILRPLALQAWPCLALTGGKRG